MREIRVILILLITLFQGYTQNSVWIKDNGLRQCLITRFSSFFVNDSLQIDQAAAYAGTIECNNNNIISLDGIQYFKNAVKIKFDSNSISIVPSLAGMNNLEEISLNYNKIDSVSSFQVLPKIKYISLIRCNAVKLPSFNGMNTLEVLQLPNNKLSKVPDFRNCPNLTKLSLRNSPTIDSLPDFTQFQKLETLYLENMNLSNLPDLSKNSLLKNLLISGNNFTFKEIIQMKNWSFFNTLSHDLKDGMNLIYVNTPQTYGEKSTFSINLGVDDTVKSNQYNWYKNHVLVYSSNSNFKTFNNFSTSDTGNYIVKITNYTSGLDSIILSTVSFKIGITPCFFESNFVFNITKQNCNEGTDILISENNLKNGTNPYTYSIINTFDNSEISNLNPSINNLKSGKYLVKILDKNGCEYKSNFLIQNLNFCDNVISPLSDQANKYFYFDYSGSIKVINSLGKTVKTFTSNNYWDGQDKNGNLVPIGLYTLVGDNGQTWYVTVIH